VSATWLLSELRRRAIQLRADGSELRCSAPAGALTAELREQLRQHKSDLLALLASAQAVAAQARAVVPLQRSGRALPIFGVPGHNGDIFCYRSLSQALGENQPFFGLQPPGLDGEAPALVRVEALAAYFIDQMGAFGHEGPCIVAGFCAGGTVAFELAQQLEARGTPVRFLALFGCPYPVYFTWRAQLWLRPLHKAQHAHKHARALAARSWSERRAYVANLLEERRARRAAKRAAADDPVLARRAAVERATLIAVRAYRPRPFPGRVRLFLPGTEWRRSGVEALRWRAFAGHAREYYGPQASDGTDMLREAHAPAFAELFSLACKELQ
jgi:thioesterase domain-containing protein